MGKKDYLLDIDEFRRLEKLYSLEEICTEECPMCSHSMKFYESKYVDGASVRFCWNCHELQKGINIEPHQPNVCTNCGEIVRFEDEDENNFIICSVEGCANKAHLRCVEEYICDSCNIWACEEHVSEYYECETCGCLHDDSCMVSLSGDFIDTFGIICESCFYRDDDLIDEIKRPFKTAENENALENIDCKRNFYIYEAKENFDLTIMLTHLIKGTNPFELLKNILSEKSLKASETGYYHSKFHTKSVCFADLTVRGLQRHSKNYSPFGLSFLKELVFEKGGGPALYIREDLLRSNNEIPDNLKPFINKININSFDFHHEREWRVPNDFKFEYNEISIVYAPIKYQEELRSLFPEVRNILDLDILQLI